MKGTFLQKSPKMGKSVVYDFDISWVFKFQNNPKNQNLSQKTDLFLMFWKKPFPHLFPHPSPVL